MGGSGEEVVRAFNLVSTGEIKKGGSCCSDPSVDLLGAVGGKEAFFPSLWEEEDSIV